MSQKTVVRELVAKLSLRLDPAAKKSLNALGKRLEKLKAQLAAVAEGAGFAEGAARQAAAAGEAAAAAGRMSAELELLKFALARAREELTQQAKELKDARDALRRHRTATKKSTNETKRNTRAREENTTEVKRGFRALQQFNHAALAVKESLSDTGTFLRDTALKVAAFTTALAAGTNTAAEYVGNVEAIAAVFGATRDEAQALLFAFERQGLAVAEVNDALATSAERAQDAADGTQSFVDAFKLVGLAARDLQGKKPAQQFSRIMVALRETEDASKRAAAAAALYGTELGVRLARMARRGTASLEEMQRAAEEAGALLSVEELRQLEAARGSFKDLGATLRLVWRRGSVPLSRSFQYMAEVVRRFLLDNLEGPNGIIAAFETVGDLVSGQVAKGAKWVKWVMQAGLGAENAEEAVRKLAAALGLFFSVVLGVQLASLVNGLKMMATTLGPVLLTPIGMLAAVLLIAALLVEDMVEYFTGGKSLLGEWVAEGDSFAGVLYQTMTAIQNLWNIIVESVKQSQALRIVWDMVVFAVKNIAKVIALTVLQGIAAVLGVIVVIVGLLDTVAAAGEATALGFIKLGDILEEHIVDPLMRAWDIVKEIAEGAGQMVSHLTDANRVVDAFGNFGDAVLNTGAGLLGIDSGGGGAVTNNASSTSNVTINVASAEEAAQVRDSVEAENRRRALSLVSAR